ncbi:STRC-like protein [Mya arenaria]|uniref:STRC-like protein n=1 Tax=Mya arenaria TaxID=6604 RepID=A0ABY7DGJ9_MYAAR|nr:STRC-like protein [Mya arenaria]
MQLLGSGVTAMTAAQISAMADDDFLDCASFLGSQTGWDADQLEALLAVALRSSTYGSSSGWTADHVYSVGIIAQSLSTSEITALSDLDIDAMYSIGRHDGWDVTQVRTTYLNTIFDMFGIGI